MKHALCVLCLAAIALLAGCGSHSGSSSTGGASGPASGGGKTSLTIAVIPKGTTFDYWKSVDSGAQKAGKDLGVQIEWKGPLQEDDRAGQIEIVQQFIADGVSGIVLAPLDEDALAGVVQSAQAKKIPVVIIDSALKGTPGKDFASFVATDNEKGGQMAGQQLVTLLGGKGKVVMLRYEAGSASTAAREQGFLDAVAKAPGIQIISDNNYGGATIGDAQTKAMQMIDQLKQASGIFCPNEFTTLGMLHALQQNGLAGKVKLVGFDPSPPLIAAVQAGQIDALVAQNPVKMGYDGVQTVVSAIHGHTVPTRIDTGATLVTKDNLSTPAIQKLLSGT